MSRLSEVDRRRDLVLLQAGLPISEVSLRMNLNRTTIFRVRQSLHETDTVSDQPRCGKPRCTTQRQDRNLVRNHMNNRFLSASASSRHTKERNNQRISANTVRRRLSTSGLRARRPYIGPILTQRLRHQRTPWAQEHVAWDRIQWRSVVFSDESRFCIDHAPLLIYYYPAKGKFSYMYKKKCYYFVHPFGLVTKVGPIWAGNV
ncbi:transposable element Tc1 transposase [Elysia marginata]|uniref:Transposable element Tc1 transposase n=1 Tax=Elysia marginata TaxID=1093978 RepID=A0AAV4EHF2_9GAST|nr:transposable element Tc1 transposase [Elysia marginata]